MAEPIDAEPIDYRARYEALREYVAGDAHSEMAAAAGVLRLWADPKYASSPTPGKLTSMGDRLADCCRRARLTLGVCPKCGGAKLVGADPCPVCTDFPCTPHSVAGGRHADV